MRFVKTAFLVWFLAALPLQAQWTSIGDMPQPARSGNTLRFANAQAVATVTALSPDIIRVRVTPGQKEARDHSYAVVNREFGGPGATFAVTAAQSTVTTTDLMVTIRHAPFRIAFATRDD